MNDTSISSIDLQEFLSLKLREGINFEYSMRCLVEKGNVYANYMICFMLVRGLLGNRSNEEIGKGYEYLDVSYKDITKAREYYKKALIVIVFMLIII